MVYNIIGIGHEAFKYYALLISQTTQSISSGVKIIWEKDLRCTFEDTN